MTFEEYREFKDHVDQEFDEHKERESRLLKPLEEAHGALKAHDHLESLAAQMGAWDALALGH